MPDGVRLIFRAAKKLDKCRISVFSDVAPGEKMAGNPYPVQIITIYATGGARHGPWHRTGNDA
jgi:hypothetical protein